MGRIISVKRQICLVNGQTERFFRTVRCTKDTSNFQNAAYGFANNLLNPIRATNQKGTIKPFEIEVIKNRLFLPLPRVSNAHHIVLPICCHNSRLFQRDV